MSFPEYTPTETKLVTLFEADDEEPLAAATTNVSLEQLADGIAWLNPTSFRVWAKISCNGLGAIAVNDHEGISVAGVAVSSTLITIAFSTPFASGNYCPIITSLDGTGQRYYKANSSTMTTTSMQIYVMDPLANVTIDPSANICVFSLAIVGRQ